MKRFWRNTSVAKFMKKKERLKISKNAFALAYLLYFIVPDHVTQAISAVATEHNMLLLTIRDVKVSLFFYGKLLCT